LWLSLASLTVLLLTGCSTGQVAPAAQQDGPAQPKVQRLVVAAVPPNAETSETRNVNTRDNWQVGVIYERLFANDPLTGKRNPQLLTAWNLEPDGLTYRFKLREGIKFHYDQGTLTSQDALTSFKEQMREDSLKAQGVTLRASVKAITAVNDNEFVVQLSRPAAEALFSLGQVDIFSHNHLMAHGPATLSSPIAGTGPYLLQQREQGSFLRFERVSYSHWRVKSDFPEIEMRFMKEPATRLAAMIAGEAHLGDIPVDLHQQALARGGFKVITSLASEQRVWVVLLGPVYKNPADPSAGMNHADSPLADVRVRRALSKALDRDKLNKAFMGGKGATMIQAHFTPNLLGWNPEWEKRFPEEYGYDEAKARALLVEAGYGPGRPAQVTMPALDVEGLASGKDLAEAVATMWMAVGVDVKLDNMQTAQFTQLSNAGRLNSHARIQGSGTDQYNGLTNLNDGFRAGRTAGISILAGDAAFKQAKETLDEKKQDEFLRAAGNAWYDQHHSVPLFWLPQEVVANSSVVAEYPFPGNVTGIWTHLEYIKAAR
jgi:peptide/nickel transport system substrate-binding protein